ELRADPRASCKRTRVGTAKLQREGMLGRVETQKPRPVAMQHRAGREHLGIKQRAPRQQAMEEPAMPVGPFHHRSDGEFAVQFQVAMFPGFAGFLAARGEKATLPLWPAFRGQIRKLECEANAFVCTKGKPGGEAMRRGLFLTIAAA